MKMMNKAFKILTIVLFTFISMISCAQKKEDSSMNNAKPTKAIIGVIGAGNVGGTLGKKWANAGYKVLFSSRNPEELKELIGEVGHQSEAVSVEEAAKRADIVVLAVPFKAEAGISAQIQPFIKGNLFVLLARFPLQMLEEQPKIIRLKFLILFPMNPSKTLQKI